MGAPSGAQFVDDGELERWLALYRHCCKESGIEPLPDDEARKLTRRFHDLLARAFEREFRLQLTGDVPVFVTLH